jgi:hypothetical protein
MKQLDATSGDGSHDSNSSSSSSSSSMENSEASDTAASTLDELDEAENSMEFDDAEVVSTADGTVHSQSSVQEMWLKERDLTAQPTPSTDASFAAAWHAQLQKQGLLGALVAAAYPDRIAQAKPVSGGKPSFTLSSGELHTDLRLQSHRLWHVAMDLRLYSLLKLITDEWCREAGAEAVASLTLTLPGTL